MDLLNYDPWQLKTQSSNFLIMFSKSEKVNMINVQFYKCKGVSSCNLIH